MIIKSNNDISQDDLTGWSAWRSCSQCMGRGRVSQRIRKKAKREYHKKLELFKKSNGNGAPPTQPKGHLITCTHCDGSGLNPSITHPVPDSINYPHVAIIGGGIAGVALAVACLHRGVPFTLFERDPNFEARSQGYGLTLQQASKAMEGFGIHSLDQGVVSTRHVVHHTDGTIIGEWGMRKWLGPSKRKAPNRTNIHIARQSLRLALLEQLGNNDSLRWDHQLIDIDKNNKDSIQLTFLVDGIKTIKQADLVVGADGIRSTVRRLLWGDNVMPLRYLDCIVILGICPLESIGKVDRSLLDNATVFQTANGMERIYMMPYDQESIMWQLSFPMTEEQAITLGKKGSKALKVEAMARTPWHDPIPQIIKATNELKISGYPVYDRALLHPEKLRDHGNITLIGDAAHPMSPFKGQGANQALLDALALARGIFVGCRPQSEWKQKGLRPSVLNKLESQMMDRAGSKVKDSAAAAQFLHSDIVLHKSDEPRGRVFKNKK